MKDDTCVLFGGNGGLGRELNLNFDNIYYPTSKEVDLTFETSVERFFQECQPSTVINLAVVNVDSMLHKTQRYNVERQVAVNVLGMTAILRHCLPYMRERKEGRVIFVSSILATKYTAGTGVYAACKAFNETLIKVAAQENKHHGITCNVLRLGYFDRGLINGVSESVRRGLDVARLGTPEDLSSAIEFVVKNPYINGAVIDVNGAL